MEILNELSFFPTREQLMDTWTKKPVAVTTNHYSLSIQDNLKFYEWRVRFIDIDDFEEYLTDPSEVQEAASDDCRTLIGEILKANTKELRQKIGSNFMNGTTMFSIAKWSIDEIEFHFKGHPEYIMVCQCIKKNIEFDQLADLLDERSQRRFIRYLNNHLKHMFSNQMYIEWDRTRGYYNLNNNVKLESHNLVIFNGYKSSFNIYEKGIRLLFDSAVRIVKFNNMWDEFIQQEIPSGNHELICDFFIGKTCMANYGNNRVYRIDDIDFMLSPMSPFPDKTYKNYEEYFMEKYKVSKLKYPDQFMLVHKSRVKSFSEEGKRATRFENIYLIAELVFPVGVTTSIKDNSSLGVDLSECKFKEPNKRFGEISNIINSMNEYKDDQSPFQLRINHKDNIVTGYSLDYPKLKTGNSMLSAEGKHIKVTELADGKKLTNWILIYDFKHEKEHEIVVDNLIKAGGRYNLEISKPLRSLELPKNATVDHIEQLLRKEKLDTNIQMIFFVVARSTARFIYKKIKAYYNSKGIVTQFLASFNSLKDVTRLTKYNNILLQMMVKLGGTVWEVESDMTDMMIGGVDVHYPNENTSVVSLVSQMGENFNTYYSLSCRQNKRALIMKSVYKMVLDSIKYYVKKYNKPPSDYLFFRKGIRRTDYDDLIEFEITRIVESLRMTYKKETPRLTFVVVDTKVSDRIAISCEDGLQNPKGGLVVINDVVEKNKANFMLVSQTVNQGSACPTHYEIVYSDGGLKFDKIVDMAYSYTYGYSSWMGSLRVPSMIKNATKLSRLVGISQEDSIDDRLKEVLFFL